MANTKKLPPLPVHEGHARHTDMIFMMVPLAVWAVFLYGKRPLAVCLAAVVTAWMCDWLVCLLRGSRYDRSENSSVAHALLLAMLMPATVPYYVVAAATAFAVLIGKAAFGGYGAYPFHPTAVGYAMAAVSWPQYLFKYPAVFQGELPLWGPMDGVIYSEGISHIMRNGGVPGLSRLELMMGNYASPIGTASALILASCGLFLLVRRRLALPVVLGFLGSAAAIAWCFPRVGEARGYFWQDAAQRLLATRFEVLSGAMLFCVIFFACDSFTCPRNSIARLIYGVFWGALTMVYRYYGSYTTGVCYAALIANATSGYIDRMVSKLIVNRKGVTRRVGEQDPVSE